MDFVRKVVDGIDLNGIIEIPNSLVNQKVEVLIFPVDSEKKNLNLLSNL